MSVDVLLNAAGKLAAHVRNSGVQAKVKEEEQGDAIDPAKFFSALLEEPQGEGDIRSRDKKETKPDGKKDARDDSEQRPVAALGLPQTLLSLTSALPERQQVSDELNSETTVGVQVQTADFEVMPTIAPDIGTSDEQGDEVRNSTEGEKLEARQTQCHKLKIQDHKPTVKLDMDSHQPVSVMTDKHSAESTTNNLGNLLKAEMGTLNEQGRASEARIDFQPPQVAAKNTGPIDGKAATEIQTAVRITDVHVVSERSFGVIKTLQIRLDPAELGAVTARIRVTDDGVEVHLVADQSRTAEILASDRSVIEKALKAVGVGDDTKISVTVADRNGPGAVQHMTAAQNVGAQQQGHQQAFNMQQQGFEGRNGNGTQAQFMDGMWSGGGRQDGESGQAAHKRADRETTASESGNGVMHIRGRGLVV